MNQVSIDKVMELLYYGDNAQGVTRSGFYNIDATRFEIALNVINEHNVNILPFFDWITHLSWEDNQNVCWTNSDFETYGKYVCGEFHIRLKDDSWLHSLYKKALATEEHLATYEHQRYEASLYIRKPAVRNTVFESDDFKCRRCGTKDNLTIDHIKPVVKGGENKISNLQTLCKSCNSAKGGK